MKSLLFSGLLLGGILGSACQGPDGAVGPQGPRGAPGSGANLFNEVFEVGVTFIEANGYFESFALDPEIGPNDVVLVYLLWEEDNNVDVWRPLPQTNFIAEGILQYSFDFTRLDFGIFLDANFPLNQLGPQFTDNQFFRVVLVPGEFLIANPHGMILGVADDILKG
jgi:hypothetical protein